MKSKRLSDGDRTSIRKRLLSGKFEDSREKLKAAEMKLNLKIIKAFYSSDTWDRLSSAPIGDYPTTKSVNVNFHGMCIRVTSDKAFPLRYNDHWSTINVSDRTLKTEWDRLENRKRKQKDLESALRRKVSSALWSVNTSKQLIELWPEIRDVVISVCKLDVMGADNGLLPVATITNLNKELSLKKKK